MDKLTSINVFRQVVESGSFVGAAGRLDLSIGMVSKYVTATEKRLGVRLLNRNSRGLCLTEAGRVYLERCKGILEDLEQTESELECLSCEPRGSLRIAYCHTSISGGWLGSALAEYRQRWPEVQLDVAFEDRAVNLVEEGYDLVLRLVGEEPLPAGLVARRVRAVSFRLAASGEYIKRRGTPKLPEDLRQHEFVSIGGLESLSLECPQGTVAIPLRVVLRCRAMADAAIAVAAGIGLAPLPTALFDDPLFMNVLTPVLTEFRLKESTLYLVYADRKYVPFKVRAFIDLVLESGAKNQERMPVELAANCNASGQRVCALAS